MLPSWRTCPRLSGGVRVASAATASDGLSPRATPTATAARAFRMLCSPPPGPYVFGTHVGSGTHTVGRNLAFEVTPELRNVFIVGVEHCRSIGGKGFDQFVFRPRDAGERIEKLQVHGRDVRDYADLGLRDFRQRANLARMRHAHLDDGHVVLWRKS